MGPISKLSALAAAAALVAIPAAPALAEGPDITRDSYVDRFEDDFLLDLCGIETITTVEERWSVLRFPDGSEIFHVVRTFTPDHPGVPVEKGAGTTFIAPDGSRTVVGVPIHLFDGQGGTTLLDAGRLELSVDGVVTTLRGPHPAFGADLREYYCPS